MADYVWTTGSHIKANAQIVGDELETLQQINGGRLTARVVVEEARRPTSPLHPCFEWDDVRAAELWRENEARHVLACIRVVEARDDKGAPSKTIRAFVNLTETVGGDEQRGYIPIARVLSDADLLRQAVQQAANELRSFEERYASFEVIAAVGRAARERVESLIAEDEPDGGPISTVALHI